MISVREAVVEDRLDEFFKEIGDEWESDELPDVFRSYLAREEVAVYEAVQANAEDEELTSAVLPLLPHKGRQYIIEWSEQPDLVEALLSYVDMLLDANDHVNFWKHTVTGNVFVEVDDGRVEDPSEEFMYCYAPNYETRDFVNLATRLKENQLEEL